MGPSRKVVVSGATGFVGRALLAELESSHPEWKQIALTRDTSRSSRRLGQHVEVVGYDPDAYEPSDELTAALEGAEALIHLAGEPAVGRRLTETRKKEIRSSRVGPTTLLVRAMSRTNARPKTFLSASAVGYYGPRDDDEVVDETGPAGNDFLARVCVEWERAANEARSEQTRVVLCRLGIVLGRDGGALEAMARPVRLLVGGKLGSGKQMVSWVHQKDAVRALTFALDTPALSGPVNVTAPNPCSNSELTTAIGRALGRPTLLSVPEFALRAALGEGADPLTKGQRVVPRRLLEAGFEFLHEDVNETIGELLAAHR